MANVIAQKSVKYETVEEVSHEDPQNGIVGKRHPLLQFVILCRLCRFADTGMIKLMRQVCKVWNEAAIHVLNKRLVYLTLCQIPDEWEEAQFVTQLQSFLDFDKWRVKNNLCRDFAFWDLTLYDIHKEHLFIKLLEGGWRSKIRKLQLTDFTSEEINCVMENLIRSLPNLTELILSLDTDEGAATPLKRFGKRYVKVNDTAKGPWTSPLRKIEIIAQKSWDYTLNFEWNFLNSCPNLNSFLLECPDRHCDGEILLAKLLKDLQTSHPRQIITTFELIYYIRSDQRGSILEDQAIDFVNFYSIKHFDLSVILSFDRVVECLRRFKAQTGIQSLRLLPRLPNSSQAKSYEYAMEMLYTLTTGKLDALTSLTLHFNCWDHLRASFNNHKYWNGSSDFKPLRNLTKLEYECIMLEEFHHRPYAPKFTFAFFEKLPQVFPNLVEFKGCQANVEEFRFLISQLSQLHNFQVLSIYRRTTDKNPEFLCNKSLFGMGSEDTSHKGLFGLKNLRRLSLTGRCENLNGVSIKEGFAKLPSLQYLTINLPETTMFKQSLIDELEGKIRVEFV